MSRSQASAQFRPSMPVNPLPIILSSLVVVLPAPAGGPFSQSCRFFAPPHGGPGPPRPASEPITATCHDLLLLPQSGITNPRGPSSAFLAAPTAQSSMRVPEKASISSVSAGAESDWPERPVDRGFSSISLARYLVEPVSPREAPPVTLPLPPGSPPRPAPTPPIATTDRVLSPSSPQMSFEHDKRFDTKRQ